MRRTSVGDLVVPFAVIAAAIYLLLRARYESVPPLQYTVAVPIAALAIIELILARRIRGAVTHDPEAKAMTAIVIARCVALGKASALVAAGLVGAAVGLLARVVPDASTVRAAASDLRVGLVILAVSVLLLVSGLLLERAGIVPRDPRATEHP